MEFKQTRKQETVRKIFLDWKHCVSFNIDSYVFYYTRDGFPYIFSIRINGLLCSWPLRMTYCVVLKTDVK